MSSTSIWNSIEVYCASRNFGYDQYLSTHGMSGAKGAPLHERAYKQVSEMLHLNMLDDFNVLAPPGGWKIVRGHGCQHCLPAPSMSPTAYQVFCMCGTLWNRPIPEETPPG